MLKVLSPPPLPLSPPHLSYRPSPLYLSPYLAAAASTWTTAAPCHGSSARWGQQLCLVATNVPMHCSFCSETALDTFRSVASSFIISETTSCITLYLVLYIDQCLNVWYPAWCVKVATSLHLKIAFYLLLCGIYLCISLIPVNYIHTYMILRTAGHCLFPHMFT